MSQQRDPRITLALYALVAALIYAAAFCLMRPTPNPTPSPATRIPVTVLPTVYIFVTSSPVPTVTPREMLLAPTKTVTPTFTPIPTATPTPGSTRVPVQRG